MKKANILIGTILGLALAVPVYAMPDMTKTTQGVTPASITFQKGKVAETMNSGGYTYILLDNGSTKTWFATPEMQVKVGDEVELESGMQVEGFTSKTLNKKFDHIIFSAGTPEQAAHMKATSDKMGNMGSMSDMGSMGMSVPRGQDSKIIQGLKVEKATGANAYNIEEIINQAKELNNKTIQVKGQVVRVLPGIMKRNWVHIKDGTGTNGANEIVVTTQDLPTIGQIVTVTGVLHAKKDFGSGYKYKTIIEDATVK
ncbi:MAG: DNA-binding protein [Desulfuromonadales bacterium]|nr:DNA-binding protein [Desulfuromonadales bacterium]